LHHDYLDRWRNFSYLDYDFSDFAGVALYNVLTLQPILFANRRAFETIQERVKKLGIARSPEAASVKNLFLGRFPACFRPNQH